MLAAQAKERQKIYCGNQYDKKSGLPQNSAEVQKGETREDLAKKQNQAKKANAFKSSSIW